MIELLGFGERISGCAQDYCYLSNQEIDCRLYFIFDLSLIFAVIILLILGLCYLRNKKLKKR